MSQWILKDMTGKTINSWKVLRRGENSKSNKTMWVCKCLSCGREGLVSGSGLRSGKSKCCKHCGNKKHGGVFDGKKTRLYRIWSNMRGRCTNIKLPCYKYYGGKGISICEEWSEFENFKEWALLNGYEKNLTIDRIDGNGNYFPENCRWTTQREQLQNRPKKNTTFTGVFYRKYKTDSIKNKHYVARIERPGFFKFVGSYYTELEAAIARELYLLNNDLLKNHTGNFLSYEKITYKEKARNEELYGTV